MICCGFEFPNKHHVITRKIGDEAFSSLLMCINIFFYSHFLVRFTEDMRVNKKQLPDYIRMNEMNEEVFFTFRNMIRMTSEIFYVYRFVTALVDAERLHFFLCVKLQKYLITYVKRIQ